MKAKKENKVYRVDESSKQFYLDQGYDIYDDEGKLIENSPLSKISIVEHKEIVAKKDAVIAELEQKIKDNEKKISADKKEVKSLKDEIETLKNLQNTPEPSKKEK